MPRFVRLRRGWSSSRLRCAAFAPKGLRKTTIVGVGCAAGVSRSTTYEYFPDKRAVVDAASEHASQRSTGRWRAMDRGGSLKDRLSNTALAVTRARRFVDPERLSNPAEVSRLLTRNARRCCANAASS